MRYKSSLIGFPSVSVRMELNVFKYNVFAICGNKKRNFGCVDTNVSFMVEGVALPIVTADSEFRSLGVQLNRNAVARIPLSLPTLRGLIGLYVSFNKS